MDGLVSNCAQKTSVISMANTQYTLVVLVYIGLDYVIVSRASVKGKISQSALFIKGIKNEMG